MNRTLKIVALVTITFAVTGRSQGVLNAGDSWSYHFTNMDNVGTQSFPTGGLFFPTSFSFRVTSKYPGSGLQPEVTFDLYEGHPGDGLIASENWYLGGSNVVSFTTPAWQDLEGSVTFTVDSGAYLIDSFTFTTYTPTADPTIYNIFQKTVTPAPEPSTFSLLVAAALIYGFIRYPIRRSQPNTALEPTPHSRHGLASKLSDFRESQVRGGSAFGR